MLLAMGEEHHILFACGQPLLNVNCTDFILSLLQVFFFLFLNYLGDNLSF